jgi:hypothetical protein
MGFEEAAVAILDEDQRDAIVELLNAVADVYIKIFNNFKNYYRHLDGFYVHDDWGSQQNTFFSPQIAADIFVPVMRRITRHLHELGYFAELHSCGRNMAQIENIVAAGWDIWEPQSMNDTRALYRDYGDKIILGVYPEKLSETASEEEQVAAAHAYADAFCQPGRPSILPFEAAGVLKPAYRRELYRRSRENYGHSEDAA